MGENERQWTKRQWLAIGRGKSGWHAQARHSSLSGAYAEDDGDRLALEAADGAPVYDASRADDARFTALVMSGPMLAAHLEPMGVDAVNKTSLARMLGPGGLQDGFRSVGLQALRQKGLTSLDRVGWGIYRQLLEEVGGVRFGSVKAGKIVWETA